MRITLVSPFDPYPRAPGDEEAHVGGVERVYAELAPRLAERGHEVTLVCSTDGLRPGAIHEGVRVIRIPRVTTVMRAPAVRLHEAIPSSDVVQAPATYPLTTPAVIRHAEKSQAHSVLDFHFEPRPGSLVGRLAAAIYRPLGSRVYPRADRVLVRSEAYAQRAPSLSRVPSQDVRVVPNGVDPERFTPEGPRPEGEYLLFVGRLVPYKGLNVLLEALARAEVSIPLLVAGEGPSKAKLEATARSLDVDVSFLGHVNEQALPQLYRGARLTVLPSINRQEAFGITLIESMACGTPVLASDLPGVREVAQHGGLTAPPGDAEQLAARLEHALGTDLPRGSALATRIHEEFSWQTVADRTEEIYQELTGLYPTPGIDPIPPEVPVP